MQSKPHHKKTTRRTGKSLGRRNRTKKPGCTELQPATHSEAIVADSIYSLKLGVKKGIEVYFKTDSFSPRKSYEKKDDYGQMYSDLLACLHNGLKLLKIDGDGFDPLKLGLPLPVSIDYVIRKFEECIMPRSFNYNIEFDESDGYFFRIMKDCEFDEYWHHLDIKPIVHALKKQPALLNLFIAFIRNFGYKTGIDFWWHDTMAYCMEWLESRADELMEYEHDEDGFGKDYALAMETLYDYQSGMVMSYQKRIQEQPSLSSADILARLKRIRKKHPVLELIEKGCEIMDFPYMIQHYMHWFTDYNDGEVGVRFECQLNIIWDSEDEYSARQMEFIDCDAQQGIYPPVISHCLYRDSKELDLDWLINGQRWPMMLDSYFQLWWNIIEKLKPNDGKLLKNLN